MLDAMSMIEFVANPNLPNKDLNDLFSSAWPNHQWIDFAPMLSRSLVYIAAFSQHNLIGFVNVAWDGGIHAFLLNTTAHQDFQKQGIGKRIVERAIIESKSRGMNWIHVDYEKKYDKFYKSCGFLNTEAGIINLTREY